MGAALISHPLTLSSQYHDQKYLLQPLKDLMDERLPNEKIKEKMAYSANPHSLSHLSLFIFRIVALYRSRFWTQPPQWMVRLPAGYYTFGVEVTFKVLRREDEARSVA
jgi:hypothetical protein